MSLKSVFFGNSDDELTNADAIRFALQCIAIGLALAYFFGPTEYGLWGLMAKAASYFNLV